MSIKTERLFVELHVRLARTGRGSFPHRDGIEYTALRWYRSQASICAKSVDAGESWLQHHVVNQMQPSYGKKHGLPIRMTVTSQYSGASGHVEYDAHGRRTEIDYGNGAVTTYAYDPLTFRLTSIVTTRSGGADTLQDLHYTYDPVGEITDTAQPFIFYNNQVNQRGPHYVLPRGRGGEMSVMPLAVLAVARILHSGCQRRHVDITPAPITSVPERQFELLPLSRVNVVGAPVEVMVVLRNTGPVPLWITDGLAVGGPADPAEYTQLHLDIVGPDEKVRPYACHKSYIGGVQLRYFVLMPHGEYRNPIRLDFCFDFDQPGSYHISARYRDGSTLGPVAPAPAVRLTSELTAEPLLIRMFGHEGR